MPESIPVAQHKLRGTYRRDRHGIGIDFEPDGVPEKPGGLTDAACRFWDVCLQPAIDAGVIAATDTAACESAAFWYGELSRLREQLGSLRPGGKGYYRALTLAAMAEKQFASISQRMGLTPLDRRKVRASSGSVAQVAKRSRYIKRGDDVADRFFIEHEPKDKSRFVKECE